MTSSQEKTKVVETSSRVWTAMSMTEELLETSAVRGLLYCSRERICKSFQGYEWKELLGHSIVSNYHGEWEGLTGHNIVPNYHVGTKPEWDFVLSCAAFEDSSTQGHFSDKAS